METILLNIKKLIYSKYFNILGVFGLFKLGISLALIIIALARNKYSLIVQNTNKGCNKLTLYIKELYTKFSLTKTIIRLSSLLIEANYF